MKALSPIRIGVIVFMAASVLLYSSGDSSAMHLNGVALADRSGPAPGEEFTIFSSGVFTYSKTDMSLPGPMPINVTRVYRSRDVTSGQWNLRDFGEGTRLSYDIYLHSNSEASNGTYADAEVVMPDGGLIECQDPNGTNNTNYLVANFICNEQPTGVWFNSVITWNPNDPGWDLTRPDGTVYHFGDNAPLQTITDRYGNQLNITHGGAKGPLCSGNIPSSSISSVSSSNGRSVYFCYDNSNDPTGISAAIDTLGVKVVNYNYDSTSRLIDVTQTAFDSHAITSYGWNQSSNAGQGDLTQITTNDGCRSSSGCDPKLYNAYITYAMSNIGTVLLSGFSSQNPPNGYQYADTLDSTNSFIENVEITMPDGATRHLKFDAAGYLLSDIRNLNQNGVSAETTAFVRPLTTTIGDSHEFVKYVNEADGNGNLVRQTMYTYDPTSGDVMQVRLSPEPGQATCCSTNATWTYGYEPSGTGYFNRLTSASEPLSYAPTKYVYVDGTSSSTVTVTDPVGVSLTTTYNAQGLPVSIPNALGYLTTVQYNSYGDMISAQDPIGSTTNYQPDNDGRVMSVTSPLNETTTYEYDALDDVTDIYDPLSNHTSYGYDLIGQLHSVTTPKGYTTTITRTANLGTITVTDASGNFTTTDLDNNRRKTDYTDKRGVETTYKYDLYGRVTNATINATANPSNQETVAISNYDALDRLGSITDSQSGNVVDSIAYQYDSIDNILSETTGNHGIGTSVQYTYDKNGRRVSMEGSQNDVAQPVVNYGYDCDDRLIGMSNNGSAIQSCSPTNDVTNGNSSNQIAYYYEGTGVLLWMLSNGVFTWDTGIDIDGRITERDFDSYPQLVPYGTLTYTYDADGRIAEKGGSLAAVGLPPDDTATYSPTDQIATWNGVAPNPLPDAASNIISDLSNGLTYSWDARNQMVQVGGNGDSVNSYDPLSRRIFTDGPGDSISFLYDESSVLGFLDSASESSWNFEEPPGGGAIAGTVTSADSSATWVPLLDADGSTIALVNAAQVNSPPETSYKYDPYGGTTVSGATNSWPLQYKGWEHVVTDPAQLDYSGGGQFYNPQIQRGLSETQATTISGAPSGPGGVSGSSPSHGSQRYNSQDPAVGALAGGLAGSGVSIGIGAEAGASLGPPGVLLGALIGGIIGIFDTGSSQIVVPRKDQYLANGLDPFVTGADEDLTKNEKSSAPNYGYAKRYGNYCGDNWTGGLTPNQAGPPAPPIDSLDSCCASHDKCFGEGDFQSDCACNASLWSCASSLPANPHDWKHPAPAGQTTYAFAYTNGVTVLFGPSSPLNEGCSGSPGLP